MKNTRCLTGETGFAQVFKAPEHDQAGNCIGIQIIFWDITQKHKGDIKLRNSESRTRALFESAGDAILLVDHDGRIVESNPAASDLLKVESNLIAGKPLDRFAKLAVTELTSSERSLVHLDENQRNEVTVQCSDGSSSKAKSASTVSQ